VEVVDAITMEADWAATDDENTVAAKPTQESARRQKNFKFFMQILQ
jgi:hypothetical protein